MGKALYNDYIEIANSLQKEPTRRLLVGSFSFYRKFLLLI